MHDRDDHDVRRLQVRPHVGHESGRLDGLVLRHEALDRRVPTVIADEEEAAAGEGLLATGNASSAKRRGGIDAASTKSAA